MYHQIGEPAQDPWNLSVSAQRFQEHQAVLRRYRTPMSLAELAERRMTGRLPRDAVAVTFDDGYANNLHLAKPALQRFDVPATVFVISGYLNSPREAWWDELADMLLGPTVLPEALRLTRGGQAREWAARAWTPSRRLATHRAIHRIFVRSSEAERQLAAAELRAQIGGMPEQTGARRPLSTEELLSLAEDGLVEIGAHTVTHPSLPRLPYAMQHDEIRASKESLEAELGRPVRGFAYPYGDHEPGTVRAVSELGFSYACVTAQGFVHPHDSPFRLPRFTAKDWDGEEFSRRFVPCNPITRSFPLRAAARRAEPDRAVGG